MIEKLYAAIDPVSEAIGKLVDFQIAEAQRQFEIWFRLASGSGTSPTVFGSG